MPGREDQRTAGQSRHARRVMLVCIAGAAAWVFREAIFGGGMFAFRDAAHYYYPLLQHVVGRWAEGSVPLWNPYENLGQPLAGNPTSAAFYPGLLIFMLPIGYAWGYKLYILAHLLLAAAAAYGFARRLDASVEAAGLGAIAYAFSGNVLYQYCNAVFLVGAAWLPAAMLCADRMLRGEKGDGTLLCKAPEGPVPGKRVPSPFSSPEGPVPLFRDPFSSPFSPHLRWALAFGAVLAMMVLGGDPQMAYNAGLLAAMYAVWLWWDERFALRPLYVDAGEETHSPARRACIVATSRPALLALAAGMGVLLSAVQVLPSLELARRSDRQAASWGDRLLAKPTPHTHHEHTYHFSVGPWRLAEFVWPNIGGRQFPIHRRWFNAIPGEGRVWTPSLYMGILPLLLALSAMRFLPDQKATGTSWQRWLTWSTLLAIVASLGWYGLGWIAREIVFATTGRGDVVPVGAPAGGVYWLMTLALPGYFSFRYPAKLLVVAALGISILAARGWDEVAAGVRPRFARVLLWLGILSGIGVLMVWAIRPYWSGWLAGVGPDSLFGPLDTAGAWRDVLMALGQTAVLCVAFWWLLRPRPEGGLRTWQASVALVLVAADLAVSNGWMVACAPAESFERPSAMGGAVLGDRSTGRVRVYRHPIWMRPEWRHAGSRERIAESLHWDRDTLFPKYHLPYGVRVVEVTGSMMLADYKELLRQGLDGPACYRLSDYVILPGDRAMPGGRRVAVSVPDVSLWENPNALPRAWIAEPGQTRRPRHCPGERCEVVEDRPERVELEVRLFRRGVVVLADQFYPGWQVQVVRHGGGVTDTAEGWPECMRVNRAMRGIALSSGCYRLIYRYRPMSVWLGVWLSGLGWLVIVGLAAFSSLPRRRESRRVPIPAEFPPARQ